MNTMRKFLIFGISIFLFACKKEEKETKIRDNDYLKYVNPLMGTDSSFELSNGNTYPAVAVPWGMNFWTPQTGKMGDGWVYQYDSNKIRGIKQTHQPSPWINDYAAFSIMAVTDTLLYKEEERQSWFSHKSEVAKPNYYKVYLADYHTEVEVTPTSRGAKFRFTFPKTKQAYVILDAFFKGSMVKVFPYERKIIGYCKNNSGGVPENFKNHFVGVFNADFKEVHTFTDNWKLEKNTTEQEGNHTGAILGFETGEKQQIELSIASSFISLEQAELNLQQEVLGFTFDEIKERGSVLWNTELSKIAVEDDNVDYLRTFYSCLYRVLLFPRAFYEYDKEGKVYHYSPYSGNIEQGYLYTDNGFWDTFRSVFPLFNLVYPSETKKILAGLANTYKESGWLPEWASPGHRDCMIGSNSASIIADAHLKGNINEEDIPVLFEAMLKNATQEQGRPQKSVGREGINYYNELGYVPYDVGINESVARTLEYAYADFCISQMANKLGKSEITKIYEQKALNYKNVFDSEVKWMRGRLKNGAFQSPFNPLKWGDAFTEGNSLHYTWSVFHDVKGLIDLMGGEAIFEKKLDTIFNTPPHFDDSYYGFPIHEIREMQITNMGNYAHGNQPIQHMIYLYNDVNRPDKAQKRLREVLTRLYAPTPDGYCGDEDNGQTSAWYVFSALGFYPVTPATNSYAVGAPLFKKITISLENGKQFVIHSQGNRLENYYVRKWFLKGKEQKKYTITFDDIISGGDMLFEMQGE